MVCKERKRRDASEVVFLGGVFEVRLSMRVGGGEPMGSKSWKKEG